MRKLLITSAAVAAMVFAGTSFAQGQNQTGGHTQISLAVALGNSNVAYGVARRHSKEEAIKGALSDCKKVNNTGVPCETVETFGRGCIYVTINQSGTNPVGWASSSTLEGLYSKCSELNMTCKTTYATMCNY